MATARAGGSLLELARLGFTDLDATIQKLDALVGLAGDGGRVALGSLSKSANPDQALNALLDLGQIDAKQLKNLLKRSESADRLCLVLGASTALVDFVKRHPQSLELFDKAITSLDSQEVMTERMRVAVAGTVAGAVAKKQQNPDSPFGSDSVWNAIRVEYRRELLRIAIYDLSADTPWQVLQTVAAALADSAGAAIECGLDLARAELTHSREFGVFTPQEVASTNLAVIAMGKCGARELNYISDVDVIFVAGSASDEVENHRAVEVATKLATRMMRAMDATATEPSLWQVDPNLRPEGKSGALVRTLESHIAYYERWAEGWEFQALLKARHLAGSRALGEAYVAALNPMVWTSAKRENFVENVQKMRQRVLEHIPTDEVDRQIKLGPGGLRDVEFTVQLLQLVHGRTDESVRHRDTLSAIDSLRDAGYIGRVEAQSFADSYRFLRSLEHRIQLSELRRTHLMPRDPEALRTIARSLNLKWNADSLTEHWERVKNDVRGLHQRIFFKPLLTAVAKLEDASLALSNDQVIDRLGAIGFLDPKGALAHIRALTSGLSRRASIQKQLLPVLIEWFARGSDPDAALLAFRRLSEALGESPWYLRMLRDASGAAERMTEVLSNSRLATELFERMPEAAAWFEKTEDLVPLTAVELANEFEAINERHTDLVTISNAAKHIRRRETLRVAIGAVLDELGIDEVAAGLSDITEQYLKALLEAVRSNSAQRIEGLRLSDAVDFAIIAMGRFGGQELGFGSDADVMFVYRPMPDVAGEIAQKAAERIVTEIRDLSADPLLEFQLDLDLRPEGTKGAIVRSIDSYAAYYERWSDSWEAQALLRARLIAGSAQLVAEFESLINRYRYPKLVDVKDIMEIRRIKARVETERLPLGADPRRHLKLGRGSLSDVEWLVQLLQLENGGEHPTIRTPRTLDALHACVQEGLIEKSDANVLEAAWILASRVRSASVLYTNKSTDVLPHDRRQLEGIARILNYPPFSAGAVEQDYLSATRRARAVFERLFYK
jgi:glutamate-ammonia-ligase adenylyltransferase